MENSYGIGIANRYDLFYMADEAGDQFETPMIKKKSKQQKQAAVAVATVGTIATVPATLPNTKSVNNSSNKSMAAEKENKASTLNKNQKDDQNTKLQGGRAPGTTAPTKDGIRRINNGSAPQTNSFGNKIQDNSNKKDGGKYTTTISSINSYF